MNIILQHKIIMSVVLVLFFSGTIIQLLLSHFFSVLISETENMAVTEVTLLCQCKRKFSNCYRLHNGILNVPVFVEKFLNKIKMGRFTVLTWKHISGQLILLSVFTAGLGACQGIIEGNTLGEILPFYIISMFDLYLYFAISGFVDITEKKRVLKINLVDYLENHMGNKIEDLEESIRKLEEPKENAKFESKREYNDAVLRNKSDKAELEELLREFLA
ncbi:MAG: hypothetical protein KIG50_05680 [Lachnospiraceae bacterium]|nr:hypothetical protein [Lachnospiraceae bacterium]